MSDTPTPRPNPASRLPKIVPRTPGDYGRGHLKVDNMLREEDRNDYLALLRLPATTGRAAHAWLVARGYKVGSAAVKRHKQRFNQKLETIRTSAEMSLVCADLVRQVGVNRMSDAAVLRFETLLTEALFKYEQDDELPDKEEWATLGRALTNAVSNRTKVETVRLAAEEAKRKAEHQRKPVRSRQIDGNAVSDKVRRMLGMPLPGEPLPALPPPPVDPEAPVLPLPSAGEASGSGDCPRAGGGEGGRVESGCEVTPPDSPRSPSP